MNTINLLIVATNKYTQFLPKLIESVDKYFFRNSIVVVTIFSDKTDILSGMETRHIEGFQFVSIPHKPWPYATLNRFHFFKENYKYLGNYDYYFYIDADTIIKDYITEDILSASMAVQHCGFIKKRGSYETNPNSAAYVAPHEGTHYFGGGFWGFGGPEFWHCVNRCVDMIDRDTKNGIVPVHNDESVLNRYFIDFPPSQILSPSYHYPESHIEKYKKSWEPHDYPCKILLLDKNHEEIRK
jgi:histo-blood group ABO system transferase